MVNEFGIEYENHVSRKDRCTNSVMKFLEDKSITQKHILLLPSEVKRIEETYPNIKIKVGAPFPNSKEYHCTMIKINS